MKIGVVTVARSDYSIYYPLLKRIEEDSELELFLIVTGAHLSPEFGMTVQAIEEDGFKTERVEMLLSSDSPEGISKSMGLGTIGFAEVYSRAKLDLLIVLGDRFEMHSAVVAAVPFNIPIAHIHGGELTEGAIDDSFRHSITKMSHLHFVSTETYARRVRQMGEERVVVSGALSFDSILATDFLSKADLSNQLGITFEEPILLITYHPVTLELDSTEEQIEELLAALEEQKGTLIFTYPNADPGNQIIIEKVQEFTDNHSNAYFFKSLGRAYYSLMKLASVIIGNSSSGITEAALFSVPVVNIGNRQKGRMKGANVIDTVCDRLEIKKAIDKSFSLDLQLTNPYGDGQAVDRIISRIKQPENLLVKRFKDYSSVPVCPNCNRGAL